MIITSDYGSFPHSLLSTSKIRPKNSCTSRVVWLRESWLLSTGASMGQSESIIPQIQKLDQAGKEVACLAQSCSSVGIYDI